MRRREFLSLLPAVVVACRSGKILAPCEKRSVDLPLEPAVQRLDVNISGGDLDSQLAALNKEEALAVHLSGQFETKGVYRWGQYARHNLGKDWTVDGDAAISLAPDVQDNQPLFVFAGPARSVSGVTVRGNHSQLVKSWNGSFRTGAVVLYGKGKIDRVTMQDFGSLHEESFVAEIVGAGAITNSVFEDFHPEASDSQVTVFRIMGSENGEVITDALCLMEGNETYASGDNRVQAHTMYWTRNGVIRNNKSRGARVGVYGDWGVTSGLQFDGNAFEGCEHGFQFRLAPGDFSHADYRIGANIVKSGGKNVSLDTCGPPTATRFIRGMEVDSALSVEAFGANWKRASC